MLKHYYNTILKYDLLYKYKNQKINSISKLTKIILDFGCKTSDFKILASSLLALELLTKKKGRLTISKHANITLKIRKGNPVGCRVILMNKFMYKFLDKELVNIMNKASIVKLKNFNNITYHFKNSLIFKKLEMNYTLFNLLKNLQITIVANTKFKRNFYFILNSFKLLKTCKYNSIGRV